MLPLAHFVAAAFVLAPGFAADAAVVGLRPAGEVRAVLAQGTATVAACAPGSAGTLLVDVELLAAGYVDHVVVVDAVGVDIAAQTCVRTALRALSFRDRGKEPATHALIRVAFTEDGRAAPKGTSPKDAADALEVKRDDIGHCVDKARETAHDTAGTVLVSFTVRGDGAVTDVDTSRGTLVSPAARACIKDAVNDTRFSGGRSADEHVVVPFAFDHPSPRIGTKRHSAWEEPTLFRFLGCGALAPP